MHELIKPTASLHGAWLEARDEWGPGLHEDGFGLLASDETDSPEGFATWLARLAAQGDPAGAGRHGGTTGVHWWIVEDDGAGGVRVQGGIALRYGDDDYARQFGHVGFGVRPSARRRGLATRALGRVLGEARALGLDRVVLTCRADNTASARTIAGAGAVFDGVRDTAHGPVRRYHVDLGGLGSAGRRP
ncbi:GNAT family N-acetyltransferase [Saccharothrix longispora]|uniref:GNAT family N-acetyltransferase n=1 Tax=Saccharothrix longispora TaxID=33920 RepID=UPI0028FDA54F|nr:GNAT family N-acetyltransferase [Saccharothrix longispora]MBY8851384.1 GNAT family N-acetyltransferase [Saccharothrix sp. MB29]MDU0288391.1 GNAT family N-acetyltransferase [Saccharothrix longispora]